MSEDIPAHLAGFRAGSLLAGYRLEAQVGAGGMAVVFRARDERLGRLVALKILVPTLASDSSFRRRFVAESRAAAAVDDPHIIPVYEAGEADGVLFIAMRFVRGGDLRRVLEREGMLPPDRAAGFISPVASALDAAHRAELVHRDVKPANILVDAREDRPDHVYLSDFGVSKGAMSAAGVTGTGQFIGTAAYSAPEQIEGRTVDGRTDQYALACVTYELLTGELPFERDQGVAMLLAHLSATPPSVVERLPDLPGAVDEVVAKGMAKVPEKRYESCGDFADALRAALGLAPYHPRSSTATPTAPPAEAAAGPALAPADLSAVPADLTPDVTVDSAPGGGSVGVAGAPAEVLDTGPGPQGPAGREAEKDTGTAEPRRRGLRRLVGRERRGPPPTPSGAAGEGMPAAAAGSQVAGDLGTATGPSQPAHPQAPVISPSEIPSLATAAAEATVAPPDLAPSAAPDLAPSAAPDLAPSAPPEAGDAVEPDLAPDVTVDSAPSGGSIGVAEVPGEGPVAEPGAPGGEADDDAGRPGQQRRGLRRRAGRERRSPAPPATAAADEGLPAAAAAAAAEGQLAEDLGTAAWPVVPAQPQALAASTSEIPPLAAAAEATVAPADPAPSAPAEAGEAVVPDLAPHWTVDSVPGGSADVAEVPADILATGPGRAADDDAGTAPPTVAADVIADAPDIPGWDQHGLPDLDSATDLAPAPPHPQREVVQRRIAVPVWIRRHRLPAVALASAILAALAVLPFVLTSPGKSSGRTSSQGLTGSPGPTNPASPANSLTFSRSSIDLPASYRQLITSLAFRPPAGGMLAIAALNTCLWDFATGGCTTGRYTNASSVAFSPDGKIMAAGDANGNTYLWDLATQQLKATLPDPGSQGVNSVAFSHDGSILAAGDSNGNTYLWSVAAEQLTATLPDRGSNGVYSVAFSRDGTTVAAGGANGTTYLWDVATHKLITPLTDPAGKAVDSVAFSSDGKTLAAGDANGTTYLWNVAAAASASSSAASTGSIRLGNLTTSPVDAYVYSSGNPSPQIVMSGLTYGTVSSYQLVNAGNYTVKMRSAGSSASSTPVFTTSVTVQAGRAYTAAALTVATGGRQAKVLDDSLTTPAGKSLVRVIQASLQKNVNFYCSCGGFVTTKAAPGSVSTDAPIPPGHWTMTATGSSAKASLPVTLTADTVHTEIVLDTTGGGIQVVNLVDAAGPGVAKLIATLQDPDAKGVNSVAFSPDGQTLAAGDANGSTYVWNVAAAQPITTLTDPNSAGINAVAFSQDGKTLAIGDENNSGRIYLWHISSRLSIVGVNAPALDRQVGQFVSGRARSAETRSSGMLTPTALAPANVAHVPSMFAQRIRHPVGRQRDARRRVVHGPARTVARITRTAAVRDRRVVLAPSHLYCKHSASSSRCGRISMSRTASRWSPYNTMLRAQ